MHELGIVYQVVKTIDEVKQEQGLTEISSITLEIGEMSDVIPKYIENAWNSIKESTQYPDAEFIIEIIRARAKCKNCGNIDYVKNLGIECPLCGSVDFEIISGKEFNIKEITAK